MEKKLGKWERSRRVIASFLLATTILLSVTPEVHAEDSQSLSGTANVQMSTKEVVTPNVIRHEGYSRDNVAENVAQEHFSDSNKVILVNREKFPDAISATNISQGRYPVLYTHEGHVTESTMELIQSMSLDEIYVLGGNLSVNESVVNQLTSATNVKVTRIAGRSRYDANVSAVKANFNQKNHVVIASGEVYSDALYGVSYANTIDAPVILTKTSGLETSTVELLKDLDVKQATIIGGTLTVTPDVEKQLNELGINHERIAGRNRYIGSAEVATASYQNPKDVVIASGEVFSDALVSAPLAQKLDAPILLVKSNTLEQEVINYLKETQEALENIYIQGGSLTISESTVNQIVNIGTQTVDVERETVVESTPFETIRRGTNDLKEGEEHTVQEGITGQVEIVYETNIVNGVEQGDRTVVSETVIRDAQPQIVEYGTNSEHITEDGIEWTIDTELFNQEKLRYINAERVRVGVEPLEYMPMLQQGVNDRVADLLEVGGLRVDGVPHVRPDGSEWSEAFNYLDLGYFASGENLAMSMDGFIDTDGVLRGERTLENALAEAFYEQFANSPGHYSNMISDYHTGFSSGVGVQYDKNYDQYHLFNVQIFGVDYT